MKNDQIKNGDLNKSWILKNMPTVESLREGYELEVKEQGQRSNEDYQELMKNASITIRLDQMTPVPVGKISVIVIDGPNRPYNLAILVDDQYVDIKVR